LRSKAISYNAFMLIVTYAVFSCNNNAIFMVDFYLRLTCSNVMNAKETDKLKM